MQLEWKSSMNLIYKSFFPQGVKLNKELLLLLYIPRKEVRYRKIEAMKFMIYFKWKTTMIDMYDTTLYVFIAINLLTANVCLKTSKYFSFKTES